MLIVKIAVATEKLDFLGVGFGESAGLRPKFIKGAHIVMIPKGVSNDAVYLGQNLYEVIRGPTLRKVGPRNVTS